MFFCVFPTAPAAVEGVIRLVNGSGPHEGRVEVFYSRLWGTVCDDGWDKKDGDVVCRMLGFQGAEEVYRMAAFGQGKVKHGLRSWNDSLLELSMELVPHEERIYHNALPEQRDIFQEKEGYISGWISFLDFNC